VSIALVAGDGDPSHILASPASSSTPLASFHYTHPEQFADLIGEVFFNVLLVCCPINKLTQELQLCEDGVGGSGPCEGTMMQIVTGDVGFFEKQEAADQVV
jgi:hypothetical protein